MLKDEISYSAIELLKNLISIPSVSREEGMVADFLFEELKRRKHSPYRLGNNLWCCSSHFDERKSTLLLNSHLDTVKPVTNWTFEPFLPTEKENRIYGLGSNDAGASLVSLLSTFELLQREEQPYNLIFLATAEEEVSGKNGISSVLPELPRIDLGVVGEPTELNMAIAEKGLMVVDCISYGKSGHAALSNGENAIYKAIGEIEKIRRDNYFQSSPLLGDVHLSVTMIEAGTQHNVIPDKCSFVIDVRTNELYSNKDALEHLDNLLSCEVKARSLRLNSSSISLEHPVVKRGLKMGLHTFGSPTLSDQAQMPFPTLKIGPGSSKRSHTADEYIEKKEIRDAIQCYYSLLHNLPI